MKTVGLIMLVSGLTPGVFDSIAHLAAVFGYTITPPVRLPGWAHVGYVLVVLTGAFLRYPEQVATGWAKLGELVRGAKK